MVVGAIADIGEDVRTGGKRRFADPVGALTAHLGNADRLAVHPFGHVMTANASNRAAALRHDR